MKKLVLVLSVLVMSGCYHATVNTGMAPGTQQIDIPWAHSFIYGLVPPGTVEAEAQCTSGVARVETQHSFINMLAQFVTFGLYSPMHITVTCASGEDQEDADLAKVTSEEEFHEAVRSGDPFLVPLR